MVVFGGGIVNVDGRAVVDVGFFDAPTVLKLIVVVVVVVVG